MFSYLKFRLQRQLRRFRRQALGMPHGLSMYAQLHIFSKWRQLAMVRSFVLVWWGLVALTGAILIVGVHGLTTSGQRPQALSGGTYTEALIGTVKNVNPILPEGGASSDVSRLIFSGLTRFNARGEVEGDLATAWVVSADGKTYTFKLRRGMRWHDGVPVTAQDAVFTLAAIQNPDTRSPLATAWKGVKVEARDDLTVVYSLPKPFAPFINATTSGLLPRHLLEGTEPSSLRVSNFNQQPVGTGPFKVRQFNVRDAEITLVANPSYYGGRPLLDQVVFRTYAGTKEAIEAYARRQVMGISRITADGLEAAEEAGDLKLSELATFDGVGVFLRTTSPILADSKVRQALALATDRGEITKKALKGHAIPLYGPLLPSRANATAAATRQPGLDTKKANALLQAEGWVLGRDGLRHKGARVLRFKLLTQSDSQYVPVADLLKRQWRRVGVDVEIETMPASTLQQSHIRPRSYDALLYGVSLGADPDAYPYWHSSQVKDPGLNLSTYSSSVADKALESGRIQRDPALRSAKYKAFLTQWGADTPAVMLYSPSYLYGLSNELQGVEVEKIVDPSDRFYGIEDWAIRTKMVGG